MSNLFKSAGLIIAVVFVMIAAVGCSDNPTGTDSLTTDSQSTGNQTFNSDFAVSDGENSAKEYYTFTGVIFKIYDEKNAILFDDGRVVVFYDKETQFVDANDRDDLSLRSSAGSVMLKSGLQTTVYGKIASDGSIRAYLILIDFKKDDLSERTAG